MIREHYENGEESGVTLSCMRNCAVLEGKNWQAQLSVYHENILFIDEGNLFVTTKESASAIQKTDNYYVIVTREGIETLPFSVSEIYGIRDSGKYGFLKQTYNEMYQLYPVVRQTETVRPEWILTEDSNSGFQFFEKISSRNGLQCISANGKSNIFRFLLSHKEGKGLIIADGAAFGSQQKTLPHHVPWTRSFPTG